MQKGATRFREPSARKGASRFRESALRKGASRFQLLDIEGFLWVGSLLSCLAALLLVKGGSPSAVSLLEPQGRLWWKWLLAFYLPIALGLGLLATVVAVVARRPVMSRLVLQATSAAVLLTTLLMNRDSLARLFSASVAGTIPWLVVGALSLAAVSIAFFAMGVSGSRPNLVRGLSLLAIVGCFVALPESASRRTTDLDTPTPVATSNTGERLLVIGLDGADWDFLEPLMSRGELPHLASLRETGAWGELRTLRPTRSAPIWTSVVTGVEPSRHGVRNNTVERLSGSYYRLPNALPLPRGLGLANLESLLRRWGHIAHSTVASFDRRVPAFWNIATRNDSNVDFVNWWASWPVEPIRGHIVSDRVHFWRSRARGYSVDKGFVTLPDELLLDISPLIMRPDQVTLDHALEFMEVSAQEFEEMKTTPYRHHRLKSEFKYFYSMFVSNVQIALYLMEQSRREIGRPSDLFVLLRIIDQASHQALEYSELVENHLRSSSEEVERYSRVVTEAYRAADRAAGELIRAFGEGNVVVLSDHGFRLLRPRSHKATYGHSGASSPDGVIIASGPAFRAGRVESLGIYDMMPMFLALKGWPVAEDFVRGVPADIFKQSFLEEHPVESVESYGTMKASLPEEGPMLADDEMVERLRALGYLD